MKGLLTKLGHASAHEHKWKAFPHCPFCGHEDCSGVYFNKSHGGEDFECDKPGCSSGNHAVAELRCVARKLAGCWEEPVVQKSAADTLANEHK